MSESREERNRQIRSEYDKRTISASDMIARLAKKYFLSENTIRCIVNDKNYGKRTLSKI
jgi:Mor family transcriptional regulator